MDISTSARPVSPPPAGTLRLIYEDGHVRAIDPNGRKLRMRPEPGVPVLAVGAEWSLRIDTQPEVGDVMRIGDLSWTFVPGTPGAGEIRIGGSLGASQGAIRTAINASGTHTAGVFTDGESLVSSVGYGVATNVHVSITAWGGNSFSAGTVGIDATEASAGDMLYDGESTHIVYIATKDISKTDHLGWKTAAIDNL